jgi:hypothetical protein
MELKIKTLWADRREIILLEVNPMSDVFPPPPHRPANVRGEDTLAGWRGGGGSKVRKTPDTALYSIFVSTLRGRISVEYKSERRAQVS